MSHQIYDQVNCKPPTTPALAEHICNALKALIFVSDLAGKLLTSATASSRCQTNDTMPRFEHCLCQKSAT